MRNSTQLRWMAEAEATQVREFALIQRGTSEPRASIIPGAPLPAWLDWFGTLARRVVAVGRRPSCGKQIAPPPNFAAPTVIAIDNARRARELRLFGTQCTKLIVAQANHRRLESHRCEIVVVFCDLRGFAGFAECAEPEEVMALLRAYHAALGPIVASFDGTLGHHAGDGIMVFFNDPLPCPDPARRAIDMAIAFRDAAQALLQTWRRRGHDLGFGIGISQGYATLGRIGFAERLDYTAIGTVTNLAARLCGKAEDGQILISRRVAAAVEDHVRLEEIGELALEGLSQAVAAYNVAQPVVQVERADRPRPINVVRA